MEVRNVSARTQVDSLSGIVLPPMPLNEWVDIPYAVAMRLWRMRLVDLRDQTQIDERRWWKEPDGLHIFWASPFSLGDGYGTAACQTVLAMDAIGIRVHAAFCWFHSLIGVDRRITQLLQTAHPAPMMVGICMATPGEFRKLPTPYKIGFTMYEADDPLRNLPEWRHDCAVVDQLFVPSEHSKRVFEQFVTAPIQVVPLITNPYFKATAEERIRRAQKPFVFGMHGTLTGRKSPLELIDAFQKAFPKERDVELQLKTRLGVVGANQEQIPKVLDPRVKIINDNWLLPQMRQWLVKTVDCYIFPSKGEGFGMPPREAMLAGCPTLVSNNTGLVDFANADYNWPIPTKKEEDSPLGGKWRVPDWDYLIETMRWIYHNREEAALRAMIGSNWYASNFGPEPVAQKLLNILNDIDPSHTRPRIPPAETMDMPVNEHQVFLEIIQKNVVAESKILDLGFGSGFFYKWATQNGYDITTVVAPRLMETTKEIIAQHKLPVKVIGGNLWDAHTLGLTPDAVICQGVFQDYQQHEVEVILRSALATGAKTVMFSVPSVYYPTAFGERSKLRRRGHWEDILCDFEYEIHYYGSGHKHLWVRVYKLDQGRRATTIGQSANHGNLIDGTWHPAPKQWPDGMTKRGE
jgi:glycosyltransferase involved in cell wall biosynthesis